MRNFNMRELTLRLQQQLAGDEWGIRRLEEKLDESQVRFTTEERAKQHLKLESEEV